MKTETHPNYGKVIFVDTSCDEKFLISSSYQGGEETMKWEDGNEYPVCRIDTSSASHPVYTGEKRIETKEGRVAAFKSKYGKKKDGEKKDS